ncbi:MAG: phosphotransferase, partial [Bacteroidales bacterium]|nr:phosphotransferase [Bacteroidales bacterium]
MGTPYSHISITDRQAVNIASDLFGIKGVAVSFPGWIDFNFRIDSGGKSYLLKVSRPEADLEYLGFQNEILQHVAESDTDIESPVTLPDVHGNFISEFTDHKGNPRKVRMLTWIDGRLWSSVNPVKDALLFSLGQQVGRITKALQGFEHPLAERDFEWDLARAGWTREFTHLFSNDKLEIV